MDARTIVPFSLLILTTALAACEAAPIAGQAGVVSVAPLFGPILANEVISGRADEGEHVWLLVGGADLLHVDLAARRASRAAIKVGAGERCWGLARLQNGSMWTLKGRNAVIQIDADGVVIQQIALAEPHLGLFASADRLIYQQASFTPPGSALRAGRPGDTTTVAWSEMTTRTFDRIARASSLALNMVACGAGVRDERPCWFPDEAAVSLIGTGGATRRLVLPGLDVVSPEVLLTAENPPRPVRDAYIDGEGGIWVLSSGTPSAGGSDRPGGWILARYGPRGEPIGVRRLTEPARVILRAGSGRALLLTGAGMIAEVIP